MKETFKEFVERHLDAEPEPLCPFIGGGECNVAYNFDECFHCSIALKDFLNENFKEEETSKKLQPLY